MMAPAPSAIANGLVIALAGGESTREAKEDGKPYSVAEREKMAAHATLYVLDGATGAELYTQRQHGIDLFTHRRIGRG